MIPTGTITIPSTGIQAGMLDFHMGIRHGVLECLMAIRTITPHGILHGTIIRTGEVTTMDITTGITGIITGITPGIIIIPTEGYITEAVTQYQVIAEPVVLQADRGWPLKVRFQIT